MSLIAAREARQLREEGSCPYHRYNAMGGVGRAEETDFRELS